MKGSLARALTIAIAIMVCNGEHSDFSFKAIFNGFMRFGNGPQRKDTNAQSMGTPVPTRLATTTPIPTTLAITTPIPTTVAMTTPAPVVPNPPENLEVSRVDSTSFSVTWTKPVSGDNGITGYIVYYEKANGSSTILPYDSATFNTTVRDLLPCQSYTVWVTAMYGETEGPMSNTANIEFQAPPISKPDGVEPSFSLANNYVVDLPYFLDNQDIIVQWSAPDEPVCIATIVKAYVVYWRGQVLWDSPNKFIEGNATVDGETFHYKLEDVFPYTNYTISVVARVDPDFEGDRIERTITSEPLPPTAPQNVSVMPGSEPGTVDVYFSAPEIMNGIFEYHDVWYTDAAMPMLAYSSDCTIEEVSNDVFKCTVDNLTEGISYFFYVRTFNYGRTGGYSSEGLPSYPG